MFASQNPTETQANVILAQVEIDGAFATAWGPRETRRISHLTFQRRTADGPIWDVYFYGRGGKDWVDVAAPTAEAAIEAARLTSMDRVIGTPTPDSGWRDWREMNWTELQHAQAIVWAADLDDPIRQIAKKYAVAAA